MNEDVYSKYYGLIQSSDQWKHFFGNEGNGFQGAQFFSDYLVHIKKTNGGVLALNLIKPAHINSYLSERAEEDESLIPLVTQTRTMIDSGQMSKDRLVEFAQIYDEMGFTSYDGLFSKNYPAALKKGMAGHIEHNETHSEGGDASSSTTPGASHAAGDPSESTEVGQKESTNGSIEESASIEVDSSVGIGYSSTTSVSENTPHSEGTSHEEEDSRVERQPGSVEGGDEKLSEKPLEIPEIKLDRENFRPKNADLSEEEAAYSSMSKITGGLSPIDLSVMRREDGEESGGETGSTTSTRTGAGGRRGAHYPKVPKKGRRIVDQGGNRQREGGDTIQDGEEEETRMRNPYPSGAQQSEGTKKAAPKASDSGVSASGGKKPSLIPAPVKVAAGAGLGGGAIGFFMTLSKDPETTVGIINLFF